MERIFDRSSERGSREWSLFDGVREDRVSMFGLPRFPALKRKLRVREIVHRPELVLGYSQ